MKEYIPLIALIFVAVIEFYALYQRIDGIALSIAIGTIGTLAGANLKHLKRLWGK